LSKLVKNKFFRATNLSKKTLILFGLIFAAIGGYGIYHSFAATTCLVSNRTQWGLGGTDCVANATITLTNQTFTCSEPVGTIAARAGGTPPVRIVSNWTQSVPNNNAIEFITGCEGDNSSDTIDFIFEINGVNGQSGTNGAGQDSSKFRTQPGPLNLQVTGNADCGMPPAGAHQDAWQFQTGDADRNLWIVNGTSGNWAAGTATCQGAGGGPFWTSGNGIHIIGGEYVECNHALNAGGASGVSEVIDAKFRTGRIEPVASGGDPNCQGYFSGNPCLGTGNLTTYRNVICEEWNANTNSWIDAGSGSGGSPPPAPPPTPPPPPPPPSGGTTITVTSDSWVCDQPLESYATNGMPLTVEHTIQNGSAQQNGAVRLMDGCTAQASGGRDGSIDLILHINGNGTTIGSSNDGMAIIGAHDIDITGYVNCGAIAGGAHQDGVQMNRGFRLNFINFTSGDWNSQTATCHGAGGIWYVSQLDDIPNLLQDVICIGCKMVGTKAGGGAAGTAFNHVGSLRSGARNSCFSANIPYSIRTAPNPLPPGYLDQPGGGAVDPVNENNLFIDKDSGSPQPPPSACTASSSPPPPPPSCPVGDLNGDCRVNINDLSILLSNWGSTTNAVSDLNHNGVVDVFDLSILLSNYGS
jgi:hypothetical protein